MENTIHMPVLKQDLLMGTACVFVLQSVLLVKHDKVLDLR